MNDFLTDSDIDLLSEHVRRETLEPCYKQLGKKDARPLYNRPNHNEVRTLAQIIGYEGSALGLKVGVDSRSARRWQSSTGSYPTYSEWVLICLLAVRKLKNNTDITTNNAT